MVKRPPSSQPSGEPPFLSREIRLLSEYVFDLNTLPPDDGSFRKGKRYDCFICHASEDKETVARPLADALRQAGFRVWYDEFSLRVGDSLSESIDRGLAGSSFGVVILSTAFFRKKWPRRELRGLVAAEIGNRAAVLPVWHGVTRDDIFRFSPPLADVVATDTTHGVEKVIGAILNRLRARQPKRSSDKPMLLGHAPTLVDSKGMLRIPSFFRQPLGKRVMVTSVDGERALIYRLDAWLGFERRLRSVRHMSDALSRLVLRLQYYSSPETVTDSGELRIPSALRAEASLNGSIVIIGNADHLIVWSEERLQRRLNETPLTADDFHELELHGV